LENNNRHARDKVAEKMRGVNFSLAHQGDDGGNSMKRPDNTFNSKNYLKNNSDKKMDARSSSVKFYDANGGQMRSEAQSQFT